jgi:IS4 transposase
VPVDVTITDANASEKDVLEKSLQPGRLYVLDRGYAKFSLFQKIRNAGSHFVCRIRDNSVVHVVQERELTEKDLKAGIVRDAVVRLGCKDKAGELTEPLRIVQIECTPHRKAHHNGRGGPQQGDTILIATDMMDLTAEQIGLIFKSRWQIEIFFRFFKHVLGCRHLISHCENGVRLQMYAAIIACMLMALWTEGKPTLATYEMICYWFMGWADDEELMTHLATLAKQDAPRKPQ